MIMMASTFHCQPRHSKRSNTDGLFEGMVVPCENAYLDLFVNGAGTDMDAVSINALVDADAHELTYKGQVVWKITHGAFENNDVQHNNKLKYHFTCTLNDGQMEITVQTSLSFAASDEEVLNEIAAAPTSLSGNTASCCINPTSYGPGIVFQESRKFNAESLVRASAKAFQVNLVAEAEKKQPKVVEYCVPERLSSRTENDAPAEVSDDSGDEDASMSSEKSTDSSVYLNPNEGKTKVRLEREDDELSAQQQEKILSFGVFDMDLFHLLG
jgi:hypothetical protein